MTHPDVSVVVLALDAGDLLERCLGSIRTDGMHVEVIVVDNGSRDDAVARAVTKDPSITVIRNESNVGFAAGSNMGAEAARGRFLLFMNSDAVLGADTLTHLLAVARTDASGGIWQPVIVAPTGAIENAGEYFTWSGFFERTTDVRTSDRSPYSAFAATAACLLVDRRMFDAIGGFRPTFFAYIEDVDMCWRARLACREVRIVPAACVTHEKSVTTTKILEPHEIRYLTFRNRLRMLLANAGVTTLVRVLPMYVVACLLTAFVLTISGRPSSGVAILRALVWPLRHLREVRGERTHAQSLRTRGDREVLSHDVVSRGMLREGWKLFRAHYSHWDRRR